MRQSFEPWWEPPATLDTVGEYPVLVGATIRCMPPSLGPIIGVLTICSSLVMFWTAGGHKDARIYRLLAVAWLIGGVAGSCRLTWAVPCSGPLRPACRCRQ